MQVYFNLPMEYLDVLIDSVGIEIDEYDGCKDLSLQYEVLDYLKEIKRKEA